MDKRALKDEGAPIEEVAEKMPAKRPWRGAIREGDAFIHSPPSRWSRCVGWSTQEEASSPRDRTPPMQAAIDGPPPTITASPTSTCPSPIETGHALPY